MMKTRLLLACPVLALLLGAGCSTPEPAAQQMAIVPMVKAATSADAPDFVLGPSDEVTVTVWRHTDLSRDLTIDPNGNINYPLIGTVRAGGMTLSQFRESIASGLSEFIIEPQVDISLSDIRSRKVLILGEVKSPGSLVMEQPTQAWEAVARAGGFTQDANEDNILLIRVKEGVPIVTAVNLNFKRLISDEGVFQNPSLQNGDIIYAPPRQIANVERFMSRLTTILSPIVSIERAIVLGPQVIDALQGESPSEIIVP